MSVTPSSEKCNYTLFYTEKCNYLHTFNTTLTGRSSIICFSRRKNFQQRWEHETTKSGFQDRWRRAANVSCCHSIPYISVIYVN